MHSPESMQEFRPFARGIVAVAQPEDVDHAGEDVPRLGIGNAGGAGDRAGLEALAALVGR